MLNRREFMKLSLGTGALVAAVPAMAGAMATSGVAPIKISVYKSPSCGCCGEWVKHMQANGFDVQVIPMEDVSSVARASGVPNKLGSCHTALVGAYVIEGHVPADLVKKILNEKPKILGLSVPGMVDGPPGMNENLKKPYDVIAFDRAGKTSVYAHR